MAMVDIFVKVSLSAVKDTFGDDIYKKVEGALDKGTNSATGTAIGEAARAALSSAWASAADNVCTTKNKVSGYDESSAVQIKQAIAFLFAEVVITVCKESGAGTSILQYPAVSIIQMNQKRRAAFTDCNTAYYLL